MLEVLKKQDKKDSNSKYFSEYTFFSRFDLGIM